MGAVFCMLGLAVGLNKQPRSSETRRRLRGAARVARMPSTRGTARCARWAAARRARCPCLASGRAPTAPCATRGPTRTAWRAARGATVAESGLWRYASFGAAHPTRPDRRECAKSRRPKMEAGPTHTTKRRTVSISLPAPLGSRLRPAILSARRRAYAAPGPRGSRGIDGSCSLSRRHQKAPPG